MEFNISKVQFNTLRVLNTNIRKKIILCFLEFYEHYPKYALWLRAIEKITGIPSSLVRHNFLFLLKKRIIQEVPINSEKYRETALFYYRLYKQRIQPNIKFYELNPYKITVLQALKPQIERQILPSEARKIKEFTLNLSKLKTTHRRIEIDRKMRRRIPKELINLEKEMLKRKFPKDKIKDELMIRVRLMKDSDVILACIKYLRENYKENKKY